MEPEPDNVLMPRKPSTWDGFFAALKDAEVPPDFLDEKEHDLGTEDRDPFEGWCEDEAVGESSTDEGLSSP